uniref:Uncharacterized protein n=1 Tax=Leersia perrieri TaxID=77586 RepID=A0A0D9UXP9_9ORYZ
MATPPLLAAAASSPRGRPGGDASSPRRRLLLLNSTASSSQSPAATPPSMDIPWGRGLLPGPHFLLFLLLLGVVVDSSPSPSSPLLHRHRLVSSNAVDSSKSRSNAGGTMAMKGGWIWIISHKTHTTYHLKMVNTTMELTRSPIKLMKEMCLGTLL